MKIKKFGAFQNVAILLGYLFYPKIATRPSTLSSRPSGTSDPGVVTSDHRVTVRASSMTNYIKSTRQSSLEDTLGF